jgi:hypothetical protein
MDLVNEIRKKGLSMLEYKLNVKTPANKNSSNSNFNIYFLKSDNSENNSETNKILIGSSNETSEKFQSALINYPIELAQLNPRTPHREQDVFRRVELIGFLVTEIRKLKSN